MSASYTATCYLPGGAWREFTSRERSAAEAARIAQAECPAAVRIVVRTDSDSIVRLEKVCG